MKSELPDIIVILHQHELQEGRTPEMDTRERLAFLSEGIPHLFEEAGEIRRAILTESSLDLNILNTNIHGLKIERIQSFKFDFAKVDPIDIKDVTYYCRGFVMHALRGCNAAIIFVPDNLFYMEIAVSAVREMGMQELPFLKTLPGDAIIAFPNKKEYTHIHS